MSDRPWKDEESVVGCLSYLLIALCGFAVFAVSLMALFRVIV